MASNEPIVELDEPYSNSGAKPTPWTEVRDNLDRAEVYWLSTVRADGRPHVTPISAVWLNDTLYFSTGPEEQKRRNLEHSRHCVVTTGCNHFREGLDTVVEGEAVQIGDEPTLEALAELFKKKYDDAFGFEVRDGSFFHDEGGVAHVFEIAPRKAFCYERGDNGAATRYRFG